MEALFQLPAFQCGKGIGARRAKYKPCVSSLIEPAGTIDIFLAAVTSISTCLPEVNYVCK
jgi:hypothetical protein